MVWPYDAVYSTEVAGQLADEESVNQSQERIVDLNRRRSKQIFNFAPTFSGGAPEWMSAAVGTVWFWQCLSTAGTGQLIIPIQGLWSDDTNGARIYQVRIKVQNTGAATMAAQLYTQDINYATAAGATVAPVAVGGASDTSAGAGAYDTLVLTPAAAPVTLGSEEAGYVVIGTPTVGDTVHWAEVQYEPVTATP